MSVNIQPSDTPMCEYYMYKLHDLRKEAIKTLLDLIGDDYTFDPTVAPLIDYNRIGYIDKEYIYDNTKDKYDYSRIDNLSIHDLITLINHIEINNCYKKNV